MKDVPDTETKTANEQLVAPQSVEPARESVPAVMPRVVIVGAGFGSLHAARALHNTPVQVTVIDRNNHHLFQPLLFHPEGWRPAQDLPKVTLSVIPVLNRR